MSWYIWLWMIACVVICDAVSLPSTKLRKGVMICRACWVCFVLLGVVQNVLTFANKLNTRRLFKCFSWLGWSKHENTLNSPTSTFCMFCFGISYHHPPNNIVILIWRPHPLLCLVLICRFLNNFGGQRSIWSNFFLYFLSIYWLWARGKVCRGLRKYWYRQLWQMPRICKAIISIHLQILLKGLNQLVYLFYSQMFNFYLMKTRMRLLIPNVWM